MKNLALFSWKDKSKKLKCRLLQFLFGAKRVNTKSIFHQQITGICYKIMWCNSKKLSAPFPG